MVLKIWYRNHGIENVVFLGVSILHFGNFASQIFKLILLMVTNEMILLPYRPLGGIKNTIPQPASFGLCPQPLECVREFPQIPHCDEHKIDKIFVSYVIFPYRMLKNIVNQQGKLKNKQVVLFSMHNAKMTFTKVIELKIPYQTDSAFKCN